MRSVSSAFRSKLYVDDIRDYVPSAEITLTDSTVLRLDDTRLATSGISIDDAVSSDNTLDIGSCIIGSATIRIDNSDGAFTAYAFYDALVIPYIGMMIGSNLENVKLGEYYVIGAEYTGSVITLTCYDAMHKFDKSIDESSLTYPAQLSAIIADACQICGVPLQSGALPHGTYSVKSKPEKDATTFRDLIAWAAQIMGVFARISVSGVLTFGWYSTSDLNSIIEGVTPATAHTFPASFGSPNLGAKDTVVTQIAVSEEVINADGNKSIARYTRGNSGYTISIESNQLVQDGKAEDIAEWLYTDLNGFRYRRASLSVRSDPSIEAGDVACVHDGENRYAVIVSRSTFTLGGKQEIISAAAEAESTQATRYSQSTKNYVNAMASLAQERAQRKQSEATLIERIDANYAAIGYLEADVAQIGILQADYGAFKELATQNFTAINAEINTIRTQDLTALNADVGTLQGDFANITAVLSGNIGTGQLQAITLTADNSVVTDSFVNQIVANLAVVQQLVAGSINTDNVQIHSGDNSMVITGSTQQFKDGNGTTRIQIGKDGQGNYSFSIFDASGNPLWYNDGITAGAVPNGIIVDQMVAPASGSYSGISANKLNIQSVKGAIEQGGFSSSLIYFDESQQTLNQVYTQMSSDITDLQLDLEDTSDLATQAKLSADSTASQLSSIREFISGIDTLEGMMLMLTNEAHVVHTYSDGTGGNYSTANTQVIVMVGETDVTTAAVIGYTASPGITGTWNNTTKTYQVSGLSTLDGYVDFNATYGAVVRYLLSRSGKQYTTRSGKKLKLPSGAAHLSKRFSISKALDGAVGVSYDLHASVLAITRDKNNTLHPASVVFNATQNSGTITSDYAGIFKIEETTDNSSYTVKYTSSAAESSTGYTPSSAAVKNIRCTLYNTDQQMLDMQSVVVIADADGMQADLVTAQESIQTLNTRVGTVETGIDGLNVSLGATQTELHGLSDGSLLFQTPFSWSANGQTATFRAVVYKAGHDVTDDYPARWFQWLLRTEDGDTRLAVGKTASIRQSDLGYGGTIVGRFTLYDLAYLTTRSGNKFTTRSGKYMTINTR